MLAGRQQRLEAFLRRQRRKIQIGVFLGLAVLYAGTASNELGGNLGGDNAQYLLLAKALAQGQGYVDLYLPWHPPHTKYPPLFPLLLAPFTWLGAYQLLAVHLFISFLALAVPFALAGWTRRQGYSETASLGVLLLAATIPYYYQFLLHILSEVPFMAFSYFTLWGMARTHSRSGARDLLIITLATLAALFTRTAGAALVAAVMLELLRRPELRRLRLARIPWPAFFAAVVVLAWLGWSLRNYGAGGSSPGYVQEFLLKDAYRPEAGYAGFQELAHRFFSRAYDYLPFLAVQVTLGDFHFSIHAPPYYFLPLLFVIMVGIAQRWDSQERTAEWFFIFSIMILSLWWQNDARFALPLLPLASLYLLLGIRTIAGWITSGLRLANSSSLARASTLGLGLLILLHQGWAVAGIFLQEHTPRLEPAAPVEIQGYGTWREPVMNWARYEGDWLSPAEVRLYTRFLIIHRIAAQRVPAGRVILSRRPTLTSWFTDRPSVCYLFTENAKEQWNFLRRNQVSYVLVNTFSRELQALFDSCPGCFRPRVSFPEGFPALYQIVSYPE